MPFMISSWSQAILRYPELDKMTAVSSAAIAPSQIVANRAEFVALAEASVHARLASRYTTPFSFTNLTARDLAIDTMFVQNITAREPAKAEIISKSLEERYKNLLSGEAVMTLSDGTALVMVGETAWSSTMDYHPTFGMGDIAGMAVDSSQLIDEDAERGGIGVAI